MTSLATSATGVLAADPVLPLRDRLLDESFVAELLQSHLGRGGRVTIDECVRVRTNYQVGKSLRALHRLRIDGSHRLIAARMFRRGRGSDAHQPALSDVERPALSPVERPLRSMVDMPELDTVFWTFPNDRRIANLAAIASAPRALADRFAPAWSTSRLVAYAPEKSATFACGTVDGDIVAYAKVFDGDQAGAAHRTSQRLWSRLTSSSRLRVPRPLGYSVAHKTMLVEAMTGRRLSEGEGLDRLADLNRLGAALATLHSLPAPEGPPFVRFDFVHLQEGARLISTIRPDVGRLVQELVGELDAYRPADDDSVWLHGDVHPKNGIVSNGALALIDFEDVAAGPAAADAGSFLAGLRYLVQLGSLARDESDRRAEALFDGYWRVRPMPERRALGWHTAAAMLIERALRAVTRVRPLGLEHLEALLLDARGLLRSVGRE